MSRLTEPEESSGLDVGADSPDDLVTRVSRGDRTAFGDLYDQFAPKVFELVRQLLVVHAQSEEVTREIFLEIWQNAAKFDSARGAMSTWIFTLAHRRAVDRIRSSQSGRDRDTRIGIRDLAPACDHVAETVEISLEHERVSVAMARLTELQRQAVSMTYYGGYSHSEVSTMLGVPIGTVKTRLRDGLIRLRDELGVTA